MKKNKTKKNRHQTNKNTGRNIYGQKCIAKFVKLEKETAITQYFEAQDYIDAHRGEKVEFTLDASCFTEEECREFFKKVERIAELRAQLTGRTFVRV